MTSPTLTKEERESWRTSTFRYPNAAIITRLLDELDAKDALMEKALSSAMDSLASKDAEIKRLYDAVERWQSQTCEARALTVMAAEQTDVARAWAKRWKSAMKQERVYDEDSLDMLIKRWRKEAQI